MSGLDMQQYPDIKDQLKWFIFLTHWSFLVLTLDAILQTVITLFCYKKLIEERETGTNLDISCWLEEHCSDHLILLW